MPKFFIVIAIGIASQYAPSVSESVIRVRQTRNVTRPLPHHIPNVDGFIAVRDCHHIGEIWYLRPLDGEVESFWVIDCAGSQETRDWMDHNNIQWEIDASTARRWNTVGRGIKVERVIPIRKGIYYAESYHEMDMPQVQPALAPPRRVLRRRHPQEPGVQDHGVQTGGWKQCRGYSIN